MARPVGNTPAEAVGFAEAEGLDPEPWTGSHPRALLAVLTPSGEGHEAISTTQHNVVQWSLRVHLQVTHSTWTPSLGPNCGSS